MKTNKKAVAKAIKELGGAVQAADTLGVTHPAISQWLRKGYVPPIRCKRVAELSGVAVEELNPEVFG